MTFDPILAARTKNFDNRIVLDDATVEIQAAANDENGQESVPRFSIIAYTGGELRTAAYMQKFRMPVVIDLAGVQFAPKIKANLDHDDSQRVGHVTDYQNDGRQIVLAGLVSGSGPAAREVVDNARKGYEWSASVEAVPLSQLEEIKAGQSVTVNGRTFVGPVLVARKSRLYGVAFTARGADESTSVSIAASAAEPTTEEISVELQEWIKAMGFDPSQLTDAQTAALQKKFDAEQKAGNVSDEQTVIKATAFDLDALKVEYAKHEATIEQTAFEFAGKVDSAKLAEIKAKAIGSAYDLKKKALEHEWAPTRFEVEAIKASFEFKAACLENSRPVGPAIHASTRDINSDVIEAAVCNALGMRNVEKQFSDQVLDTAHRQLRNISLQETFIIAASANGYVGRQRIGTDNIREVLTYALPQTAIHASASTVSLSGILSNVANKMLLEGFMEEDQSWRKLADVKPVSDFKTVTSYRMLDDMEYEKIGANGEIKHGKVGEESFTRSVDTYAKMFSLTRQQIINDDLGAFDDLRTRLGRGAARSLRRLFWQTFINNSSFFTSARTNYISGATTNLAVDGVGLQLGITAYRKMKSTDKKQVGVPGSSLGAPSMLVVPPELEHVASKLYTSSNLSTVQDDNIHRGKYEPVVVNELSDSDYTGYSATAWYLFGSLLKPVCVSFLNGNENPTVESADADFSRLGVDFRGYHDFGVDMAEWLSGIKSKGAA